jgi:hypothetical protein
MLLLAALTLAWVTPVSADAELVLRDGRILRGVEVRLEAGYYLLEDERGEVIAIPMALVVEMRLLDPRLTEEGVTIGPARELTGAPTELAPLPRFAEERKPRIGWREGPPQDLAGGEWTLHDARRQNAVLGEPAKFQASLPFRFKPEHAWDRDRNVLAPSRSRWQRAAIDPVWRPTPAFDYGIDVLASSRSTWSTASKAASWNPSNSFSRLRADLWWGKEPIPEPESSYRRRDDECGWCGDISNGPKPFTVPRGEEMTAERCARRLFAGVEDIETLEWAALEAEAWDEPPAGLHRAWTAKGPRALYSIAGDECRLIAGDLGELLGVDLTETDALTYAVSEWNRRPDVGATPLPGTPSAQIDLAFLLASLFESATSGSARAPMVLLADEAEVERRLREPLACSRSVSFRRVQRANVERNFEPPTAVLDDDRLSVGFTAWSGAGGEVHRYDFVFKDDGRVALTRETIAQHLGDHEDRP